MSRFIQGDCEQVMSGFPSNAVDFILTDPPYLVGYTDRSGRTITNDKKWRLAGTGEPRDIPRAQARQPGRQLLLLAAGIGWISLCWLGRPQAFALWTTLSSPSPTHRNPRLLAISMKAPMCWRRAARRCPCQAACGSSCFPDTASPSMTAVRRNGHCPCTRQPGVKPARLRGNTSCFRGGQGRWQKRFPSLQRLLPLEGMDNPLWFVIGALNEGNSHTSDWLSSLETNFSQNRLRLITQDEMMEKSP